MAKGFFAIFAMSFALSVHAAKRKPLPYALMEYTALFDEIRTCSEILADDRFKLTSLDSLHFAELEPIIEALERRLPVDLEKRAELVQKSFGIEVAVNLDYAGSNSNFTHFLLAELLISGRILHSMLVGKPSLIELIRSTQFEVAGISSLAKPTAANIRRIRQHLESMEADSSRVSRMFRSSEGRRFLFEIARLAPLDPQGRYLKTLRFYGQYFAVGLDYRVTAMEFARTLIMSLHENSQLFIKDGRGQYVLVRYLQ